MDLTNIDRLSVNGERVVCISSDQYPGQYVWNETYKVRFIDADEFGSGEISSVVLTYGIDDRFPGLNYHSPHPNYVFDGWEPDIPVGERISDDVTLVAVYTSDGRTIVTFVGDQAPRGYSPDASGRMTKEVLIAGGIRPNVENPPITSWNNLSVQILSVQFGDDVNTVGQYLLYNCKTISSVYVPESVDRFDRNAFYECTGLKRVDIADGVDWGMLAFINKYSNPLYYARYLYRNGEPVTYASTDNRFAF